MKKVIFAVLKDIESADNAINKLHRECGINNDEISYIYRNEDGEKISGDGADVSGNTVGESATGGAVTGGVVGAALGLVAAFGLAGPIGAIVAAGPIATALGLTGAVGAVATGGVLGAATGGLIGALTGLGVSEPQARTYEEKVKAGEVLVSIHTDDEESAVNVLTECNATNIEIIKPQV
jgi:uncharacterized membrane protein